MKSTILNTGRAGPTFRLVLDEEDEVVSTLVAFARANHLPAGRVTERGAFRASVLGDADPCSGHYRLCPVVQPAEVLSLTGDIALDGDAPVVHLRVVLGLPDGSTRVGRLVAGHVGPALEVVLTPSPTASRRRATSVTGLARLRP